MRAKPVPFFDELPDRNIIESLQELYSLSPGETQAEKNYAVIRMVTIIEDVFKHLARRTEKINYGTEIKINRDTLLNVLREPQSAEYTHKRILAETLSFQNLKAIQDFKSEQHVGSITIPDSLEGLFNERHNLIHSVTDTKFDEDKIENIRKELLEFLVNISCKCISGVTPNFLNGLVRNDNGDSEDAAKYFKLTIKKGQLYTKSGNVDLNAALEIGSAHYNLRQYEEAVEVGSKCIEQLNKDGAETQSNVDGTRCYHLKSDSLQKLDRDEEALDILDKGLDRYPENLHLLIAYCGLGSRLNKDIISRLVALLSNNVLWSNSTLKRDIFLVLSLTFSNLSADMDACHKAADLCHRKYKELDEELSKR